MTLAAAVTTACRKEAAPESDDPQAQKTSLTISIEDSMTTKVTGIKGDASDEEMVNSLQVFVFNGEVIDGYGTAENTKSLKIGCTVGERDIYALVNVPDLKTITSRSELLAKTSSLGNDVHNMEMIGKVTEAIDKDTEPITVGVDRFAARVVVRKVINALTSPALQKQDFVLKSMYLTNVAADVDYGKSPDYQIDKWYNKMFYDSGSNMPGSMTYDEIMEKISYDGSYETDHFFYAYPNNASHSSSDTWSPRSTMLVLKIEIGGILYNYPILLPALESNMSYELAEVRITRPGNMDDGKPGGKDEQEPVQGKDCDFTINVKSWTPKAVTEGTTI